jgi:hypothetical protein
MTDRVAPAGNTETARAAPDDSFAIRYRVL